MAKRKSRSRKGSYKYTAKRRAALKKAQLVSARKRKAAPNKRQATVNASGRKFNSAAMGGRKRKSHTGRNIALTTVGVTAVTAAGVVARHKLSGSGFERVDHPIVSGTMRNLSGSRTPSLSTRRLTEGTGEVTQRPYTRLNLKTKERTTVMRTIKGGTRILGRDFIYSSGKQGPLGDSYSIMYKHRKLRVTAKDILGTKIHNKILAGQHHTDPFKSEYIPDRGQNRTADPKKPGYNIKGERLPTQGNYGSFGKRLPFTGPRKYIGQYEIFSNLSANYPKNKTKGVTTIGQAYARKRN